MTRDELVQAAIEALGRTHMVSDYLGDHDGATREIVEVVVDTVLAKLGAVAPIPCHEDGRPVHSWFTTVDINGVNTATTYFDE